MTQAPKAQVRLSITGMTCASCVETVEKAFKAVPGVIHVSVNLASEEALIGYDSSKTDAAHLIRALDHTTYKAALPEDAESPETRLRAMRFKTFTALALSVLTVVLGMAGAPVWALLLSSAPVQFWCGSDFLRGFFLSIKTLHATMDTLVGLGTLSAWGYSAFVVAMPKHGTQDVYFEIAAFLISFILLGKYLEARAKQRTQGAIHHLASLLPQVAHVRRKDKIFDLKLTDIFAGDILLVKPGENIPVDGLIITGESSIDESMLTGESLPIEKGPNRTVSAGTLNTTGSFEMRATRVGESTALAKIIEVVKRAQASRAPIQRAADIVASYFVPVVVGLAVITFTVWYFVSHDVGVALLSAISVLIISCPCALGLATPAAIIVGMGKATEHGILIRDAEALELLARVKTVVFDKTGTLTEGKPSLASIHLFPSATLTETEALEWAASAENASEHLLAKAILAAAHSRGLHFRSIERFKAYPGGGIEALIEKKTVLVGSLKFLEERLTAPQTPLERDFQGSPIFLSVDGRIQAAFDILDRPRAEASNVVKRLRELGIRPVMISGDLPRTAQAVGRLLALSKDECLGGISPEGKADQLNRLRLEHPQGTLAMVGDGVNDAPALTSADIGIAMGSGTDVALESASVTLLRPSLEAVPDAYLLSRRTMRTIRQNLFASFFYNALGIPIAAGVLYPLTGWRLNPMVAGAAMALSSVSVLLNSLRLKRWNWSS